MFKIINSFHLEHHQWPLWWPVFIGIGVGLYFSLPFEPNYFFPLIVTLILFLFIFLFNLIQWRTVSFLFLLLSLIGVGVTSGVMRSNNAFSPIVQEGMKFTKIQGYIDEIQYNTRGKRYILSDLKIEGLDKKNTPEFIRINVNTKDNGAKPGDYIWTLGVLRPPPGPSLPGGYNFSYYAFFKQIGAVGYASYPILISDCSKYICPEVGILGKFRPWISGVRDNIFNNIKSHLSEDSSGIAAAMLIGNKGTIPKPLIENIRDAGLAHLLAISGMHMTLVAGLLFFAIRYLCATIPAISLRHDTKKWAAIGSMIGCFIYLLISNFPISAQRAYIMACLFFITILLDRSVTPLRSIAFAAIIVLIVQPESLLMPSFQMSFAAVIAIVGFYESMRNYLPNLYEKPILVRGGHHIMLIAITSIVASLATMPFSLYHFHQLSGIGLVSNIIAIPVTTFIIMPSGILSLLLMPIGLEFIPLYVMEIGIDILINTSNFVSIFPKLPSFPAISNIGLVIFSLSLLWLIIWQNKKRFIGLIAIIILCISWVSFPISMPELLISNKGNLFAIKDEQDKLHFSSLQKSRFDRERWMEYFDQKKAFKFTKERINNNKSFYQHPYYRLYNFPVSETPKCNDDNVVILLQENISVESDDCEYITLKEISNEGVHALYFDGLETKIVTASDVIGNRPWNPYLR